MIASLTETVRLPRWARPSIDRSSIRHALRSRHAGRVEKRERLVVVGSGMVSQRFCERLVEGGGAEAYELVVVGEEGLPPYDRVHLTDIWRGRDPRDLVLRSLEWYADHGIELRLRERVRMLDRALRRVVTDAGTELRYDKLVFATGSRASLPDIAVEGGASLLSYRTIDDAQRILERVRALPATDQVVAVVGGGLLGLEAARTIQQLGCRVLVLEGSSQLLPRQLDPDAAAELEGAIVAAGIEVRLRCRLERIVGCEAGIRIQLGDTKPIHAAVVVVAAGARACDEVARAAGLPCHLRGGIEVDRFLRTADARVFAIGECAAHPHVPHGLVAPGYAMADVLADNLLGRQRKLDPQRAITRLKLDLTEVNVLGNPLSSDSGRDMVWRRAGTYRRLVVDRNRIVAAISVGEWSELALVQQHIVERRRVPLSMLDRFVETGMLGLNGAASSVHSWPDRAVVCQCANVTCGSLRRAMAEGNTTPQHLARATSASTLCGSCQPLVAALCGAAPSPSAPPGSRGLVIAGAAASMLGTLTLAAPRIPIAKSIRLQSIDLAWMDPFWKQTTGFVILGFVVFGLALSLRKRVARLRIGSYSAWRLLHGALGAAGLAALFAHTGFRLGANLNLALMMAFLASAFSGALAGILTAANSSGAGNARVGRWAAVVRSVHDCAFWPLTVLVLFHVLKVYYF